MSRLHADYLARPLAHRGYHGAGGPENSLAAFRAAAEAGYCVELDVQISRDGEAMVFHDPTLDRVTGETGPLRLRDAADLQGVAIEGGPERIPSLAQVLEATDAPLLIEIKQHHASISIGRLESRVADLLPRARGPVAIMSFVPEILGWFQANAPQWTRGLISYGFRNDYARRHFDEKTRLALSNMEAFEPMGADFASFGWRDFPSPACAALRDRGVPVLSWTIRSPAEEAIARRHSDNVTFENYPAALPAGLAHGDRDHPP